MLFQFLIILFWNEILLKIRETFGWIFIIYIYLLIQLRFNTGIIILLF